MARFENGLLRDRIEDMIRGLLWLPNNLRLADNPALDRALRDRGEVLFVYVFDERTWNPKRMGPFRAQFQIESLAALALTNVI